MVDPKWAEVLDVMYRDMVTIKSDQPSEGEVRLAMDPADDDVAYLAEETGHDIDELQRILRRMEAGGLVRSLQVATRPRTAVTYGLTEQGMEVAHNREISKQQNRTNRAVALLTVGLVAVSAVDALSSLYSLGRADRSLLVGVTVLLIVMVLATTAFLTGVHHRIWRMRPGMLAGG
jgi:DNA-binding MarR family transcriptional regulator